MLNEGGGDIKISRQRVNEAGNLPKGKLFIHLIKSNCFAVN
jgi:hypothetical protein